MKKLFTLIFTCVLATALFSQVPVNDDCANATVLTVGSSCVFSDYTTVNATSQLPGNGYPSPACAGTVYGEVWFKFIAPAGGSVSIDADVNTMLDGAVAIYSGTCGNFTLIDCDDDSSPNGNMPYLVASGLTPGTEYYLAFWEYNGGDDGTFKICLKIPPAAPSNDECSGAISVLTNAGITCDNQVSGTIESSTSSNIALGACFGTSDDDVWYSFVATDTAHILNFSNVIGSTTDLYHSVYSGTCASLGAAILCSDPNTSTLFGLTIGNTYFVQVYSYTSNAGQNSTFDFCVQTLPPPPSNDECDGAISIPVNSDMSCTNQTAGYVTSATASGLALGTCFGTADDDVWYSFVATGTSHSVGFNDAEGTTTDLILSVYDGNCGVLNQLSCNEWYGNGSSILTGLTQGQTYYIRIFSWSANTQIATFNVCVGTPPPAPANDECSAAIAITASATSACNSLTTYYLTSATQSPQTNDCAGTADDDVWFSFIATSVNQTVSLSNVSGSTIDLYHSVYAGTCSTFGTALVCSDPNISQLTGLTVGNTYFVRVFTYTANTGQNVTFDICITNPDVIAPEIFEGTATNPTNCANPNGSIEILGTGNGNLTWTGTSSGNQTGITLPITITNFTAGTYNFIFNNGVASNTITVTLTNPTLPDVTLNSFNPICNIAPSFVISGGSPTGGVYSISGNIVSTFNPATAAIGANNIIYTVLDANSCSASATQTIIVNNCSGIESNTNSLFSIYPNPTNSKIVIEGDKLVEISSVELRDELGRLIQDFKGNTNSITIDLSSYSNGIYTLVLKGSDFTEIKKVQLLK